MTVYSWNNRQYFFFNNLFSPFLGKLNIEDVANDQLDDIEISLSWSGKQPANNVFPVVKKLLSGKIMKNEIKRKIILFEDAFKQIWCADFFFIKIKLC